MFLQSFASIPVQIAAARRAAESTACASCGASGGSVAEETKAAQPVDELQLSEEAQAVAEQGVAARPQPTKSVAEAGLADSTGMDMSAVTEANQAGEENLQVQGERSPETEEAGEAGPEGQVQGENLAESDEADETGEGHDRQVRGEKPSKGERADQAADTSQLSEEQQKQVTELKNRDREVRSHEQAHLAAAGAYATGGPSFEYQEGPDGRRYAVGGEVGIDTSPVSGDPEATIQKAQQIRAAALAPASPSSQDQSVAAAATQMESQARAELSKQNQTPQPAAAAYGDPGEASLMGTLLDLVA